MPPLATLPLRHCWLVRLRWSKKYLIFNNEFLKSILICFLIKIKRAWVFFFAYNFYCFYICTVFVPSRIWQKQLSNKFTIFWFAFTWFKGTLMQIWKSPHLFVFIWKQCPENFAFLILKTDKLFAREVCKFLKK